MSELELLVEFGNESLDEGLLFPAIIRSSTKTMTNIKIAFSRKMYRHGSDLLLVKPIEIRWSLSVPFQIRCDCVRPYSPFLSLQPVPFGYFA